MKAYKKQILTLIAVTLGIIFLFFLWWVIALGVNNYLFPGPQTTLSTMFVLLGEISTWEAIGFTLLRLLISFLICVISAIIVGLIAGRYEYFAKFLNPLIVTLRTLPTAAIIFTLVILLKPVFSLQIILLLMMFPIIYQAVVDGVNNIDKSVIRAISVDANVMSFNSIFRIIIPCSWHSIILGSIQALGLGMKAGIMAEVLVGNNTVMGIGRILYRGYIEYQMDVVFAISIIAIILIGGIDILLHAIKKKYQISANK